MQKRMREIRKSRVTEAEASLKSIERALDTAAVSFNYYDSLIQAGKLQPEKDEQKLLEQANNMSKAADFLNAIGAVVSVIPQVGTEGGLPAVMFGGHHLGNAVQSAGNAFSIQSGALNRRANMSARNAADMRRTLDWSFQRDTADSELKRLDKDLLAAEIRLAIARQELDDSDRQIAEAEETATFLKGKFSNAQLYGWMSGKLMQLHYQSYQLAIDLARQAEACMKFELDDGNADMFVGAGHWDSGRKGLLAGESLALDLRRMESHYLAKNKRKAELTKHISLVRLAPDKLLDLRRTGNCDFDIPEVLFDLDHPGHMRRRIKSVSLTIPAVAGPQTTIGARLELTSSFVRMPVGQSRTDTQLVRQSLVTGISTSSAQDDSGLFRLDFRDERYLPFEGAGVISKWTLTLPSPDIAQFNYANIADVIVHVRYTSEYVQEYRKIAEGELARRLAAFDHIANADDADAEFKQLLSLRYDFPSEWARLFGSNEGNASLTLTLTLAQEHFLFLLGKQGLKVSKIEMFRKPVERRKAVPEDYSIVEFQDAPEGSGRPELGPVDFELPSNARPGQDGETADYDIIVSFNL